MITFDCPTCEQTQPAEIYDPILDCCAECSADFRAWARQDAARRRLTPLPAPVLAVAA